LLVHLLDQLLIPRETAGIQIAHLIDQGLQLLLCLGTILHSGTNLVEKVQSLINLGLGIRRRGTLLPRHGGLTGDAVIPGINVAKRWAAATPATGLSVCDAVAGPTLASAGLTTLAGLTALTLTLTGLTALALALTLTLATFTLTALLALALLPWLAVLPLLLTGLTVGGELAGLEPALTATRIGLSAEARDLIAHTG